MLHLFLDFDTISALLAQNEEFAEKASFYQSLMVLEPLNVAEELEKNAFC